MKKIDNIISIMENICMILLAVYMILETYYRMLFFNVYNLKLPTSSIILLIISTLLIIFCCIDLFRKIKNNKKLKN
jgi:tryptophan-rich sensory protein